jgi:hypothetical protein
MTNHRAGKTNTRDNRPWRCGKREKPETTRHNRHQAAQELRTYVPEGGKR